MRSLAGPLTAAAIVAVLVSGGVWAGLVLRADGSHTRQLAGDRAPETVTPEGAPGPDPAVDYRPPPPRDETGAEPPDGLDWTDPEAVVRAYVTARYAVGPADADRRHVRHAPYLHPEASAEQLGHRPVDAPTAGRRTIDVESVELQSRVGHRGVWRVRWTARDPDGSARERQRDVVVQRHDGRWLIRHDTAELDPVH